MPGTSNGKMVQTSKSDSGRVTSVQVGKWEMLHWETAKQTSQAFSGTSSGLHCGECDYVATRAIDLKKHIESKHKGVRYPCLKCVYAATTAGSLKRHV